MSGKITARVRRQYVVVLSNDSGDITIPITLNTREEAVKVAKDLVVKQWAHSFNAN